MKLMTCFAAMLMAMVVVSAAQAQLPQHRVVVNGVKYRTYGLYDICGPNGFFTQSDGKVGVEDVNQFTNFFNTYGFRTYVPTGPWLPGSLEYLYTWHSGAVLGQLQQTGGPNYPNLSAVPKLDVSGAYNTFFGIVDPAHQNFVISPLDQLRIIDAINGIKFHQNNTVNNPLANATTGRFDTNSSGAVSPMDALLVINYLNSGVGQTPPLSNIGTPFNGHSILWAEKPAGQALYFDVSGDGSVTSIDALLVLNHLNGR